MTSDVGNGAVKRLAVLASLLKDLSVLVEETVGVVKASLLKTEGVRALRKTIHVSGVDSEVKTDRVALDNS